jgi:hypothetical protein
MEMSREGVAGGPGGPVPDRRWMEMSASISSTGYRVACTVSASYGQGLGEAGQIRGADRGTSAVPGVVPGSVGRSDLNLYDFIPGRLSRIAVGQSDLNLSRDPRDRANAQILSRVPGSNCMSRDW